MSTCKCQIQWVDENGNATPDNREAVGTVYQDSRTVFIGGRYIHIERSKAYPICEVHLARLYLENLEAEKWVFTPENRGVNHESIH